MYRIKKFILFYRAVLLYIVFEHCQTHIQSWPTNRIISKHTVLIAIVVLRLQGGVEENISAL